MKNFLLTLGIVSALAATVVICGKRVNAQNVSGQPTRNPGGLVAGRTEREADHSGNLPTFLTEMPLGYRDWRLVSVAHEEGKLNDIRAILGNDIAIQAYRDGKLPFPEGTIIARLAWNYAASEENNQIFGSAQSFVAGHPTNGVQFMVKDSTKYATTGGWGYGHFNDGKPADEVMLESCFPCHQAIKSRDFVFTHYAP